MMALSKSREVERLNPLTPDVIGLKQYRRVDRGHFLNDSKDLRINVHARGGFGLFN
jgi:hypothetical protein